MENNVMGLSNYIPNSRISQSGVIPNEASRPVSPYAGQVVYQLDTLRTLVWNGTAWEMINSSSIGELIEATSTTTVNGSASANIIYTNATITLTTGTWMIEAGTSQQQIATTDTVACGIYNVTTSAEVSNSRGMAEVCTTTARASVFSRLVKITVSSSTDFCPLACRNGGSTTSVNGTNIANGIAGFIRGIRVA
jgi:hypothetical protein